MQLLGGIFPVVLQKQQPRLQLVADEAVKLLQKVPALGGNAHVGHQPKEFDLMLLSQGDDLLDNFLVQIHFNHHRVGLFKNLVALFPEQIH